MSRHKDPRPPAYYTDRDSLLSQSSSSSTRDNVPPYLINYHSSEAGARRSRRPIASSDSDVSGGSMCCCVDLNTFFILLFGAIAGVNIWLTVKSSRPDGVSNFEWYFAILTAFAESVLQATWVLTVWPFRVWHRWYKFTDQSVVHIIGRLLSVKIVLFWFNFIYAWVVQVSYSWVLAWIAGFTSVDFAVAVVVGLFYDPGDAVIDRSNLHGV